MPSRAYRLTTQDPIHDYIEHCRAKGLSHKFVTRRATILRAAERFMGCPLLKANADDVTFVISRGRGRGLCDATIYIYLGHLRAFYTWAMERGLCRRNPVKNAASPRRPRYLPRPIAEGPLEMALTTADPRTRVILALAAMAGLRAVEIARLTREDIVDQVAPPYLMIHGKGDKPRTVPMSRALSHELEVYGLPRRGPVVRRSDGHHGPLSPSAISMIANQHLHSLGLPDTLHALRHYAATTLYRDTRDIRLVQDILGHASPATTAVYTLWVQDNAAAALERLGERIEHRDQQMLPTG